MEKFVYEDFTSNQLEGCALMNSRIVHGVISEIFAASAEMADAEIDDIHFVCLYYQNTLLYEWWVNSSKDDKIFVTRLPFYVPNDPNKAKAYIELHTQAYEKGNGTICQNENYILVNMQPCQVLIDEAGNIEIKKIVLWASQKMVQEYMSFIRDCTAAAQLVIAHTRTANNVCSFDIGWLVICNEEQYFLSVSAHPLFSLIGNVIKECEPLNQPYFGLSGHKYTVAEDEENGQFLVREK